VLEKARIFLAIPHMQWVHVALFNRIIQWTTAGKHVWQVDSRSATPHHRARNTLHKDFAMADRENPFTHVMWVDTDVVPPHFALDRFLEHDKDIVCGAVHQWKRWGPQYVAWNRVDKGYLVLPPNEWHGLKKVDIGTLAFCLMKADVLRQMPPGCFSWREIDAWKTDGPSEDTVFFEQVQDAGFETWVDFDATCSHVKEIDIASVHHMLGTAKEGESQ
jgi:hypothetical protein